MTDQQMEKCLEEIERILAKTAYIGPALYGDGVMVDGPVDFEAIIQAVEKVLNEQR